MRICYHFNSLAPREANRQGGGKARKIREFQLTRPTRGEPLKSNFSLRSSKISTHSPHARRTSIDVEKLQQFIDFNSLAPREANPVKRLGELEDKIISTHSPHARRTASTITDIADAIDFNSLAPREANLVYGMQYSYLSKFQLTRPTRGEPKHITQSVWSSWISTHSPHARRTTFPKYGNII